MIDNLIYLFSNLTLDDIKKLEENFDDQYKALKYLHENIKDIESFPLLVILNALVSYQLNTAGESYWWEFAKYFSNKKIEDEVEAMKDFLKSSKGNRRFINVKVKRLDKIRKYKSVIKAEYGKFYNDMVDLRDFLSKILNQDKNAKTIVFAVKMFGYAMRICTGRFVPYPFEIAIPLDLRIKRITQKFTDTNPIEFWFKVSKEVKIPPLHLDSVLWTLYRKNIKELENILPEKIRILERIQKLIK